MIYVIPGPVRNGKVQLERYESVIYLLQIWYKSKTGNVYQLPAYPGENGRNRIAYHNCLELYEELRNHCDVAELKQLRKFLEMTYVTRTVGGKL